MATPDQTPADGPAQAEKRPDDPLVMGRIVGVHGLQGGLKLLSYTRPKENLLRYREWWLPESSDRWQQVRVREGKRQGKSLVAQLEGVASREAAEMLLGREICIPRAALPRTRAQEYYWTELIGMEVINQEGQALGRVATLVETGDHDVLVVQGAREVLIPFVRGVYVLRVERKARRIIVDWHPDD